METKIKIAVILVLISAARSAPLSRVRVKFVSPPDVYEHGFTTDGDRTIEQNSYISIGRRSASPYIDFGQRVIQKPAQKIVIVSPENAESLWPAGTFIPPINKNDLGYSSQDTKHTTPDFSNGLEYPDPLLLTGNRAMVAIKYLYGRGELFYTDIPHVRAILRNQEERGQNGLKINKLGSLRPSSPFYRKGKF